MQDQNNQVANLLAKLDKTLNRNQGKKVDWKELNEARKKAFFKPSPGKNQIMIITPEFSNEPFMSWGYHNNLQETSYYSVPCDAHNKNESCLICDVVNSLKKQDFMGNKPLWSPIEQKIEHYAAVVNLESAETMKEGPKWMRVSRTVLTPMMEWLSNLEEGEYPFYDMEHLERIILNYDKSQLPAMQYKLEKKPLTASQKVSADQLAEWAGIVKPVGEFIYSKKQDEVQKIIDEYFLRMADTLDSSKAPEATEEIPFEEDKQTGKANTRLGSLKS